MVCGAMFPKANLIRLVKAHAGKIVFDENKKISGKGIYICQSGICLKTFMSGKKFKKRFHQHINESSYRVLVKKIYDQDKTDNDSRIKDFILDPGRQNEWLLTRKVKNEKNQNL